MLAVLLPSLLAAAVASPRPRVPDASLTAVQLPDGPITCKKFGALTQECLGIPFGKVERWKPPLPPAPWTAPRDATGFGPACYSSDKNFAAGQDGKLIKGTQGCWDAAGKETGLCSEQCLSLNVYAPRNPPPAGEKYPVVVWIHGGGYSGGATIGLNGTTQVETISKGDIIWVTVNYRLNIHGFLGSEKLKANDPTGSVGNYGLQDQRFALAWVQRSIGAFGGDKDNVMIDGSSAGGGSTANHFVNVHSWPFFHKTAGESGMFATWNTMPLESAESHFSLALANASCSTVACINALSSYQLQQAAQWVDLKNSGAGQNPGVYLAFSPVVDGVDVIGAPWLLAKEGHTHRGPLMLGTARDEGQMFCPNCPANMTEAGFRSWATSTHGYQGADADTLVGLYKGHKPCTGAGPYFEYFGHWTEWAWAAIELTGDAGFHCGARLGARWVSGRQPVYIYHFAPDKAYASRHMCFVMHMDEDGGIYGTMDGPLAEQMGRYWYSFAKSGNPNTLRAAGSPEWTPYDNVTDRNIKFADPITFETGLRKEQCDYCAGTSRCQGGPGAE